MGKLPDSQEEIGRLVFRNRITRKDAAYVIIVTSSTEGSSFPYYNLYTAWGAWENYTNSDLAGLQVKPHSSNKKKNKTNGYVYWNAEQVALAKMGRGYSLENGLSYWPITVHKLDIWATKKHPSETDTGGTLTWGTAKIDSAGITLGTPAAAPAPEPKPDSAPDSTADFLEVW